jgi:hypothetical protein
METNTEPSVKVAKHSARQGFAWFVQGFGLARGQSFPVLLGIAVLWPILLASPAFILVIALGSAFPNFIFILFFLLPVYQLWGLALVRALDHKDGLYIETFSEPLKKHAGAVCVLGVINMASAIVAGALTRFSYGFIAGFLVIFIICVLTNFALFLIVWRGLPVGKSLYFGLRFWARNWPALSVLTVLVSGPALGYAMVLRFEVVLSIARMPGLVALLTLIVFILLQALFALFSPVTILGSYYFACRDIQEAPEATGDAQQPS